MSLILPEQDIEIPCQYNHQNPPEFMVLSGNKIATFLCTECLTKQTLPNNAISINKAKKDMKQQKLISIKIANSVFENYVQQIGKLEFEFYQLKTYLIQSIDQSIQTSIFWREQLEEYLKNEKIIDYKLQVQSLNLNYDEYELSELIRLEQKILTCNQSFYQKITNKLNEFQNLDIFQSSQQILDQCVDESDLNNLLIKQKQFQTNITKGLQNYPNKLFLQGNFDLIQENIQVHLQNWRTYHLNTEEIAYFYHDMNSSYNFLSLLFPNFFTSQYFQQSVRLNPKERNEIIKEEKITKQLIENFQMYLCYLGVQLIENKIIIQDQKQFKNQRNQYIKQGLQRVISSLSVLNQRKNALLLIAFIKEQDFYYQDTFINYDMLQEEGNQDEKALQFQNVKKFYIQQDLIDEKWVTFKILTNQNLDA